MRESSKLLAAGLLVLCAPAQAHVRWFVTEQEAALCPCHPHPYVVAALLALAAVAVAMLARLDRSPRRVEPGVRPWLTWPLALSLTVAALQGQYCSPDVLLGWPGRVVELAVAAALAGGYGWPLALFFAWGWWLAPPETMFSNLHLLGFAIYAMTGRLEALRMGVGASLMALGLTEKLLHPALSLAFLHKHAWNFVPGLSDIGFVYAAGTVEVAVGALVALGAWPRLVNLLVLGLMAATAACLGPLEVAGHAPYLAFSLGEATRGYGSALSAIWRRARSSRSDTPRSAAHLAR